MMKIVAIVIGIALILFAIFLGWCGVTLVSLPVKIEKSYSLVDWLPPEAPKDINRFQIDTGTDTGKGVIKYFCLDKQTSKPITLTHPLEVDEADMYKVDQLLIIDGYLLVSLTISVLTILAMVALFVLTIIFGVLGVFVLILGILDD